MNIHLQPRDDPMESVIEHMGSMIKEMSDQNYFRNSGPDAWRPALNVYEVPDRFVVCVDLAGMDREKIDVGAQDGALYIRGVRPKPVIPDPPEEVSVQAMEIDSGRFQRKVPIPGDVDPGSIQAHYRNGYLWVIMPRRSQAAPTESQ